MKTYLVVGLNILVFAVLVSWLARGESGNGYEEFNGFFMDTLFTVKVKSGNKEVVSEIFRELSRLDKKYNPYVKGSYLYRLNAEAHRGFDIDGETEFILRRCVYYSMLTEGAFDITILPVMDLWGWGRGFHRVPSRQEVSNTLPLVDYWKLYVMKGKVKFRKKGMRITFGAVLKGYALMRARDILIKNGIKSALVNAGGEVMVVGVKDDGSRWKIGIRNPRGKGIIGVLYLSNESVSTSGDYERFFEVGGVRYHHILNPKTGYPARKVCFVSVVDSDPMKADILSTALFVLGPVKGIELADREGIKALFGVDKGGGRVELYASSNFSEVLSDVRYSRLYREKRFFKGGR